MCVGIIKCMLVRKVICTKLMLSAEYETEVNIIIAKKLSFSGGVRIFRGTMLITQFCAGFRTDA